MSTPQASEEDHKERLSRHKEEGDAPAVGTLGDVAFLGDLNYGALAPVLWDFAIPLAFVKEGH